MRVEGPSLNKSLTDLQVCSIKELDADEAPVAAIVASLIASVASGDGVLTPREFSASLNVADAVAGLSDDPAVVRSLTLRAFDVAPKSLDVLLKDLAATRSSIPEQARRPILESFFPLLATQAEQARPLARRIADALDIKNVESVLTTSALPSEKGGVTHLLRRAGNVFTRGTDKLSIATEIANFTGDEELARVLQADRRERDDNLNRALVAALTRLQARLDVLEQVDPEASKHLNVATSLEHQAEALERQWKARLNAIEKRIVMLRRHIKEDVEALSEDGGDAAEVDLRRMSERRGILLRSDDRDARERMISKSLAHRHDKLRRRYDEQVQLLRDELLVFREDATAAARDTVVPINLAEWRLAVPQATLGARVKDVLDRSADRTLAGGAVAAAGAAGAFGTGLIAPAAVAGVVAAPVGAVVITVVAAAGLWKLYANREERLRTEQRVRAEAVRQAAKDKVAVAISDVSASLDEVAEGFRQVSLGQIAPLRQDAERIREMCALQSELKRRIRLEGQQRLTHWRANLPIG